MRARLLGCPLLLLSLAKALTAQSVLTPSPERPGVADIRGGLVGSEVGPYNITNSFETGYRFTSVRGDQSLFRSVENYGNGVRLLGSSLTVDSKNGRGLLLDSLSLTTSGLGNDPYEMANLRIEKSQRYRYEMMWRRDDYYNAAFNNGASDTLKQIRRILQEHDLTIQVTRGVKALFGYTRNQESGPEFTHYETYIGGLARSVLPLDRNTRRDYNEYRVGTEIDVFGFRLSVTHRREYFKDDSSIASLVAGQPYAAGFLQNTPFDAAREVTYPQAATAYARSQPMHTHYRGWFGNLSRSEKYWAVNARMTYTKGDSNSVYFERESGASQAPASVPTGDGRILTGANSGFGPPVTAYTYMPGAARRPFTAGDLSFSLFPTEKLAITHSISVQSSRYDGTGNEFRMLDNGAAVINRFWTFHIGDTRVSDALEVNYRVNKRLGLNSEYRYTSRYLDNRLIRTGTTNSRDINFRVNHLNTGTFGFRLNPVDHLSVSMEATLGRDNGPLTPVSPAHFHNIRARADYRAKKLRFGATYRQQYNLNAPPSVASASTGQLAVGAQLDYYASHLRDWSANTSFEANRRLSLDLSYSKTHLDTLANLWAELVPAGSTTITSVSVRGYNSELISNIHSVSAIVRTHFERGTFYVGYNLSHDAGDGRSVQNLGLTDRASAYTAAWSTFPMTYQAPLARLSLRLSPRLQWNGGWEFYSYHQQFAVFGYKPNYGAHTGYSSVSFTF